MSAVPDGSRPRKGAASAPAWILGLDGARNWAVLVWVTLARLGSRVTAVSTAAIQAATISQRNRISNRAMVVNIRVLPGERLAAPRALGAAGAGCPRADRARDAAFLFPSCAAPPPRLG